MRLGFLLAASAPDPQAPSEAARAVASCKLPSWSGAAERGTATFVDVAGTRAVHFHEEKKQEDGFPALTLREELRPLPA